MARPLHKRILRRLRRLFKGSSADRPPELLIVATQRTGSNYLCECLRGFSLALVLREIFHRRSVLGSNGATFVLPELSARLGISAETDSDPALVDFFQREPARAWATLADIAKDRRRTFLAFKVFDKQLPVSVLEPIVKSRRPAVLFLVRKRLDVYISLMKAKVASEWSKADTTSTKIDISVEEFLAWSATVDTWYAEMRRVIDEAGLKFLVLGYDQHLKSDKDTVVGLLEKALKKIGVDVPPRLNMPPGAYFKQDKVESPFARIANGDEVEARLRDMGRLDYALEAPLTEQIWKKTIR